MRSATHMTVHPNRPLVLVADDDPAIRRLVELIVRSAGYDVITATDGEQALELIRDKRPSAAILDVSMPLRTGFEVGKALRDGSNPIAIIFLTSHAAPNDVREGFLAGACDYVFKPFSPKDLQLRLRAALGRS